MEYVSKCTALFMGGVYARATAIQRVKPEAIEFPLGFETVLNCLFIYGTNLETKCSHSRIERVEEYK